ncbi:MAG: DUF1059 domain-containing protein [Gemmatimonadetes bacterium]|nr:DUF1059 domain-containing protein [Gemmatimonadota bacterium]
MRATPKKLLCPCGTTIRADTDAELVRRVQAHARAAHDQQLTPEEILARAELAPA